MIPLLEWYRAYPDDNFFLLEIAMGALSGQLTNIDVTGATSMFFHAYPWVMDFDPHSGDYGLGFFGNALESGGYYVNHPRLGQLCYLCSMVNDTRTGVATITLEDGYHRRVFIEPFALYLVAVAGVIARVEIKPESARLVSLVFNATEFGERPWSRLRLSVHETSSARGSTGNGCKITQAGEHVLPVPTDNNTFAFLPAKSGETEIVLNC